MVLEKLAERKHTTENTQNQDQLITVDFVNTAIGCTNNKKNRVLHMVRYVVNVAKEQFCGSLFF
jgi:hypothetical protein